MATKKTTPDTKPAEGQGITAPASESLPPAPRRRPLNKFRLAEKIAAMLEEIPFHERAQVLSFVMSPRQPELPLGNA